MNIFRQLQEKRKYCKGGRNFLLTEEKCKIFERLYSNNISDYEIARQLGLQPGNIYNVRKVLNLPKVKLFPSQKELILTHIEEEVLIGTILGDGSITKKTKKTKHSRIVFSHSLTQERFCIKKSEYIKRIITPLAYRNCFDKRTSKIYSNIVCTSISHPLFTEMRNTFYPNTKKIIPMDYIRDKYSALSLAIQYCDDGYKSSKRSRYICTDCFEKNNVIEFCSFLNEKFQLDTRISYSNGILINYKSNEKFLELVSPYINEDMQYKL